MDRVGRVVLPKPLREQLGLEANSEFDVVIDGGAIRLEPRLPSRRSVVEVDGWPSLGPVSDRVLTDEQVQSLRRDGQR